jgi:hypothetical protein
VSADDRPPVSGGGSEGAPVSTLWMGVQTLSSHTWPFKQSVSLSQRTGTLLVVPLLLDEQETMSAEDAVTSNDMMRRTSKGSRYNLLILPSPT